MFILGTAFCSVWLFVAFVVYAGELACCYYCWAGLLGYFVLSRYERLLPYSVLFFSVLHSVVLYRWFTCLWEVVPLHKPFVLMALFNFIKQDILVLVCSRESVPFVYMYCWSPACYFLSINSYIWYKKNQKKGELR